MTAYSPNERLHDGCVSVSIDAVFPVPAGWSRATKRQDLAGLIKPSGKPDLDNIAKAVLDALNAVAYTDDSKVVALHITKRYGECGHVAVKIDDAETEVTK